MGVLGEMFPSRKLVTEAAEAGDGQGWRLGPIDLEAGVVEVHRVVGVHRVVEADRVDAGGGPDAPDRAAPPHPPSP